MTSMYDVHQWRGWDEVLRYVASGDLRETHLLEFKGEDYGGAPSAKKELAKDVAALAIDGGTLIIGIVEDKPTGAAIAVNAIPLAGVAERIDQICAGRISPPLRFQIFDHIRDPQDGSQGLLIVDVPATGIPHMVDGTYVGRDNRTTRQLTHPEVVRLLSRRDADGDIIASELDRAFDAMGDAGMPRTRLAFAAVPVPVLRAHALRIPLSDNTWRSWVVACHEEGFWR